MWVTNETKMGTTTNWKVISYRENGAEYLAVDTMFSIML